MDSSVRLYPLAYNLANFLHYPLDAAHDEHENQDDNDKADACAWGAALPNGSEPPEIAAKADEQERDDTGQNQ
jgi:hypothetical protein